MVDTVTVGEYDMLTLLAVFCVLLTISAHELGHAWAMREVGVPVKKISLLGLPFLAEWKLPIQSKYFPGTQWVLRPIILGAYVEPDTDAMAKAYPHDRKYIAAMGPIVNCIIGVWLMIIAYIGFALDGSQSISANTMVWMGGSMLASACLWVFRWHIACYVLPIVSIALMVGFIGIVLYMNPFEAIAGPVGLVDIIRQKTTVVPEEAAHAAAQGFSYLWVWKMMNMVGVISIALGLTNLLPMLPLDGGHLVRESLPERFHPYHARFSQTGFLALLFIALGSDAVRIFGYATT